MFSSSSLTIISSSRRATDSCRSIFNSHHNVGEAQEYIFHSARQAANASRYWPTGRGIFHNEEKTFLVWVGEEDHLRIISMAPGGDVGRVFQLLIDGIEHMDSLMSFTSDERLGWLTFCPTNLGTAIRASVHIKLPLLARGGMEALQEVADKWQLQVSWIFANITGLVKIAN